MMWTREKLIKKYIEFFKSKNHKEIPNAPLVPKDEASVLFTTAGMHPLIPYLLGQSHPLGKRLCNVQKCLRTTDIEKVGDTFHLTFFEMLGNWSLGDYWKKQAIEWSFEFLTKVLGIEKEKLCVTCFSGDKSEGLPKDEESAKIWQELGIEKERIFFLGKEHNWWGPISDTGPCGPCTEMFIDTGKPKCSENCKPGCNCGKYLEIWNDVFMEYNKSKIKAILVDAIHCLFDENRDLNRKLFNLLKAYNVPLIIVTNANLNDSKNKSIVELSKKENIEIFTLNKNPDKSNPDYFRELLKKYNLKAEEVIYFDHKKENVESAKKANIIATLYEGKIEEIKKFIDEHLYYLESLKQKNVDTGMGVERTLAILNNKESVYEVSPLKEIKEKVEEVLGLKNKREERIVRIISDHLRASCFILAEDVTPSNLGRGYVLRRLIRRCVRLAKLKGYDFKEKFCSKIARKVIEVSGYKHLKEKEQFILEQLDKEEERFLKNLEKGLKVFDTIIDKLKKQGKNEINGKEAFLLYQSYGFPLELTLELAKEKGFDVNVKEFNEEVKKHQELSRKATKGLFKSGLASLDRETIKLHTATHLLHAALRKVLGKEVQQKGSHITPERLRFDFSFDRKLTQEEIEKIEKLVNEKINEALPVTRKEMKLKEAKKLGALAFFEHKVYNDEDIVSVYFIGNPDNYFSIEVCAGPHVSNTKELAEGNKRFKIVKEKSVASGVRRIKAVLK